VELIAGAADLAGQSGGSVAALVLGPRADAEQALARGASRVLWLGELPDGALVDDCVPTLAALLEEHQPCGLLVGSTRRGRAVAGRLAARLGLTALTDVLQFQNEAGGIQARHMIFGGGALRVERPLSETVLATVGPGVYSPRVVEAGGHTQSRCAAMV
jgi:electron transfer flavoprotein alpha subunit